MKNKKTNHTSSLISAALFSANLLSVSALQASEPFLGQIEYYAFNFAPRGWAKCDGQILPINQNQSLYSLLGTTFGGDGRTSFALPDMRGRVPVHPNDSFRLGQKAGEETHSLSIAEMPSHTHQLQGTTNTGTQTSSTGNTLAFDPPDETYSDATPNVTMHSNSIATTGIGQGHNNMPPYLVINCSIALRGQFPSRN